MSHKYKSGFSDKANKAASIQSLCLAFFLISFGAYAQNISGNWSGVAGTQRILKINSAKTGLSGYYANVGQDPAKEPISHIVLRDRKITFDLDHKLGHYSGTVAPDGNSIAGIWDGGSPRPLNFTREKTQWVDPSPHKESFVTVEPGVKLEVLDWGGNGPPLIFLPGWGNSAHVFDDFALKFIGGHHVYGITRRGMGQSSVPVPTAENYDPDRMGDDVLAVMTTLKIEKPILAGHSVSGQELSSIGTRHPELVRGLIYLDAAWAFAFYDPSGGYTAQVEADTIGREISELPRGYNEYPSEIRKVLADLPLLQHALERDLAVSDGWPQGAVGQRMTVQDQISNVMARNRKRYTGIKPPFLAVIADPQKCTAECDLPAQKAWNEEVHAQARIVAAYPNATVVTLPGADHFVMRTNEHDVEDAMNKFMDKLSASP